MIKTLFDKLEKGELNTTGDDYLKVLRSTCPPSPFGVSWKEGFRIASLLQESQIAVHLQETPIRDLPVTPEVAAHLLYSCNNMNFYHPRTVIGYAPESVE